jgi:hypothetical protein
MNPRAPVLDRGAPVPYRMAQFVSERPGGHLHTLIVTGL